MNDPVLNLIASAIETDPTIPAEHRKRILDACRNPGHKPQPRMGGVREAAEILRVHPRTVQRYERRGLLTAVRLSKRLLRYNLTEVECLATHGADAVEGDCKP